MSDRKSWLIALLLLCLTGCQALPAIGFMPTDSTTVGEITVAAASDLQFAFADIAKLYEEQTGEKIVLVFGSTGQLVQQIENGARFDLIAAANIAYVDQLVEQELALADSAALYGRGRIVLAVNRKSGVQIVQLEDLLAENIQHIAIANPDHAPYGIAAKEALITAGLWDILQPKLVFGENVRQALQYVQTGDAEAGVIALSVAEVPEISWTLIDEGLHNPLDQALAILTASTNQERSRDFIAFINGPQGRPIMRQYGFLLPDEIEPRP
jgi:molybdate transport system substrate-binding protein